MTEIRYTRNNGSVRLSIVGHAMYNPGNDPVCAGVSAITYQMLECLAGLEDDKKIYDLVYEINDGSVIVSFFLIPEAEEEWAIMWKVIRTGYANIAVYYPENVVLVS